MPERAHGVDEPTRAAETVVRVSLNRRLQLGDPSSGIVEARQAHPQTTAVEIRQQTVEAPVGAPDRRRCRRRTDYEWLDVVDVLVHAPHGAVGRLPAGAAVSCRDERQCRLTFGSQVVGDRAAEEIVLHQQTTGAGDDQIPLVDVSGRVRLHGVDCAGQVERCRGR